MLARSTSRDGSWNVRACLRLASAAGAAGLLAGLLAPAFPALYAGHYPMPLAFLAAGGALRLSLREAAPPWQARAGRILGALTALIGLLSGLGLLGRFHAPGANSAAFETALLFLGAALLLQDVRTRGGFFPSQALALLSAMLCLLALLGLAFHVQTPYFLSSGLDAPPIPSALVLALSLGSLCARPRDGWMEAFTNHGLAGSMARRLLPVAVLLPVILSWLKVLGVRHGYSGAGLGPLICLAFIITLTLVVWLAADSVWSSEKVRLKAEAELETARNELERMLQERTKRLATSETDRMSLQAQLVAAQRLEALGRLAGGVAHDFNNLLTAISGFSYMLLGTFGQGDPRRHDVGEIEKACQRAAGLTSQLLAFSRRQVLKPKVLDLNALIADLQKMLQRLIGVNIELSFAPGEGLPNVYADPGQLEQVVLNFVVNSKDAMPQGGRITISTFSENLDEAFVGAHPGARLGPHAVLSVADTGCGMAADTMAHMFDPFFTTKELGKGTGLGLSTVFGIVKQSGGSVFAESQPGKGTVFRVYLPATSKDEEAKRAPAPVASVPGVGTILVVDDEEAVRTPIARYLRASGYTLLEAPDADTALRLSRAHAGPIDLLLCDVVMPGMNGYELARRLVSSRPGLKVIVMSGYSDESAADSGDRLPDFVFLQKPVLLQGLAYAIRQQLAPPGESG